ncbi:uncharacterized protein CXorf66 homolog [Camelus dromedarius]|uniref:uncharacterized protein CXorf66 homolog n=1 Tax=Camelus dromedarius TaxID=9838 RepID=UPI00057B9E1D
MNLFIYVLFLTIWINSCLDTNQSDGSPTTGAKHLESMETKMDNFRRRLLIIVIGVIILAFALVGFCFLHYYCISDDVLKAQMVKREGLTAKSSKSSKASLSESKTASLCSPEKQSMLLSIDKLFGLSGPERTYILSSAEKLIRSSSLEKATESSSPKKVFRSCHTENSHGTHSLEESCKRAHDQKLVSQASSSYPNETVRPLQPASLQYPVTPTKTPCLPDLQNQILSKPSGLQKQTKRHRHPNLKRSVSIGKADILSRPQLVKSCRCYKDKCLVCRAASEPLVNNISKAKKKHVQNPPLPRELKSFSKFFHKIDSKDNALCGNMSDRDMMTCNSDSDSDSEIIIICNIKRKESIHQSAQNK